MKPLGQAGIANSACLAFVGKGLAWPESGASHAKLTGF